MNILFCLIASAAFVLQFGCAGPKTIITGSWLNKQGFEGKNYKSVFIAAITNNVKIKGAMEEAFATEAAARNISSIKSIDFFKSESDSTPAPAKEEILNRIRESKSEAILTISLKDSRNNTKYVKGSKSYEPIPSNNYYNNFYGYYSTAYTQVQNEGHYESEKVYFIECNLYDVNNEELLWSAQSQTTNPSKIDAFSKEFASVIVAQLRSDRAAKGK